MASWTLCFGLRCDVRCLIIVNMICVYSYVVIASFLLVLQRNSHFTFTCLICWLRHFCYCVWFDFGSRFMCYDCGFAMSIVAGQRGCCLFAGMRRIHFIRFVTLMVGLHIFNLYVYVFDCIDCVILFMADFILWETRCLIVARAALVSWVIYFMEDFFGLLDGITSSLAMVCGEIGGSCLTVCWVCGAELLAILLIDVFDLLQVCGCHSFLTNRWRKLRKFLWRCCVFVIRLVESYGYCVLMTWLVGLIMLCIGGVAMTCSFCIVVNWLVWVGLMGDLFVDLLLTIAAYLLDCLRIYADDVPYFGVFGLFWILYFHSHLFEVVCLIFVVNSLPWVLRVTSGLVAGFDFVGFIIVSVLIFFLHFMLVVTTFTLRILLSGVDITWFAVACDLQSGIVFYLLQRYFGTWVYSCCLLYLLLINLTVMNRSLAYIFAGVFLVNLYVLGYATDDLDAFCGLNVCRLCVLFVVNCLFSKYLLIDSLVVAVCMGSSFMFCFFMV
eukprot:gene2841-1826_t